MQGSREEKLIVSGEDQNEEKPMVPGEDHVFCWRLIVEGGWNNSAVVNKRWWIQQLCIDFDKRIWQFSMEWIVVPKC